MMLIVEQMSILYILVSLHFASRHYVNAASDLSGDISEMHRNKCFNNSFQTVSLSYTFRCNELFIITIFQFVGPAFGHQRVCNIVWKNPSNVSRLNCMKHQLVSLELDRAVFPRVIDMIKLFHFTFSCWV